MYRSCHAVANICVYASTEKQKPIAIVVPNEAALKSLASSNGIQGESLEELVGDKKIRAVLLKEMQQAGRSGGLAPFEIIEGVALADEEWTPQNVSLTLSTKSDSKLTSTNRAS